MLLTAVDCSSPLLHTFPSWTPSTESSLSCISEPTLAVVFQDYVPCLLDEFGYMNNVNRRSKGKKFFASPFRRFPPGYIKGGSSTLIFLGGSCGPADAKGKAAAPAGPKTNKLKASWCEQRLTTSQRSQPVVPFPTPK